MSTTLIDTAPLFDTFKVGSLELRNRIVMAPMTRGKSPGHVPGQDVADYYGSRAAGGVGLIITEGTTIDHPAANGYPDVPAFHGKGLDGWKRVVESVHEHGGKIAPQIWHVGQVRRPGMQPDPSVPGVGPSELVVDGELVARELSRAEIRQIVGAYAQAAEDAERLGFDAVEIHGAHQYLIDQFLWEVTNRRADEYGGTAEKRLQFALDVVRAVRHAVSPNFPVIFRFSQWKIEDFKAKLAYNETDLASILVPLAEAGVDVFHASTRRFWLPEFEGSDETLSALTKRLTGKPVIAVGNVGVVQQFRGPVEENVVDSSTPNLDRVVQGLRAGDYDLIAIGRALLSEPQWPNKVRDGKLDAIRPFAQEDMARLVI